MSFTLSGTGPVSLASGSSVVVDPATGDRSNAIATMKKFADEFGILLGTTGYQKLPSGLIVQWGGGTAPAGGGLAIPLPTAFPNAAYIAVGMANTSGVYPISVTGTVSLTTMTVYASIPSGAGVAVGVYWIAIGR